METNVTTDPEVRREKVVISQDMTTNEIMEKYGICRASAYNAKKRGWFIKNYSQNQVIIDRDNFNPEMSYSVAKQVFWRNYKRNPVAMNIRDDMIQEAVSLMFMQSGKVKEGANEKYNERYGFWWVAHNAMRAYLATWVRQTQYDAELKDEIHPMMYQGNRRWSPEYGWSYC